MKKIIAKILVIGILCAMPMNSFAATMDLGHGSGCHVHTSSCYHTHTAGCYHAHTNSCYGTNHYREYDSGWSHDYSESSCYVCKNCGKQWGSPSTYAWQARDYSSDNRHYTCPTCGWGWNEGNNYKAPHYEWYCGLKCRAELNKNVILCGRGSGYDCGYSANQVICGRTEFCVKPSITYTIPSAWTNKAVVVNYTGTQNGTLSFTENGTKSVMLTSSTGHRVQEDITINTIDKTAPAVPDYDISKEEAKRTPR